MKNMKQYNFNIAKRLQIFENFFSAEEKSNNNFINHLFTNNDENNYVNIVFLHEIDLALFEAVYAQMKLLSADRPNWHALKREINSMLDIIPDEGV